VNGLPVWSTASSYMIPDETTSSTDYSGFAVDFGYASDNDSYTIFVGRFASAEIFAIDFIVRAESLARAPECGKVTEPATWPNPRVLMHCFMITEGRDLPMTSNQQEHFEIYSKVVSTAIIQVLPGPLPVGPVSTVTISSGVHNHASLSIHFLHRARCRCSKRGGITLSTGESKRIDCAHRGKRDRHAAESNRIQNGCNRDRQEKDQCAVQRYGSG